MNIFVLHLNPIIAAQMHCDRHVVKMIIESAQLLYTCCLLYGIVGHDITDLINTAPVTAKGSHGYRATHVNHPCCKWLSESVENYKWLITMAKELCSEYTRRYKKIHATEQHIDWLSYVCPKIPEIPQTPFVIVMPDEYKCIEAVVQSDHDHDHGQHHGQHHRHSRHHDPVASYRKYYCKAKTFAKWSKTGTPSWYKSDPQ